MPAPNLFQDLREALNDFKTFLDAHTLEIKPAIAPLDQLTGGRVTELINSLIELMGRLRTAINNLEAGNIPALGQVTAFTQSVTTLLNTAKNLLPDETATIDEVLSVASVVTGLPSVADVKTEILGLLDDIVANLNALKAP
jgi:hypothetical protein